MEPLPLKAVSREEADLLNRVFGGRSRFSFSGGPGAFTLLFVPSGSPFPPEVSARIEVDGRSLRIDLDRFFFRAALEAFLGGEDAAGLPAEVREAAAEAFLEDLLDRFERWSGSKAAIGEIAFPAGGTETAPPGGYDSGIPLHFRLLRENGEDGTAAVSGNIHLEPPAAEWLAGLLGRLPPEGNAGCDAVPVETAVEIGRVSVPLGDLKGLEKDDILLADSGAWEEGKEAVVRAGPGVSFAATLEGRTVTVRERRGEAMNAKQSTGRAAGNGTGGDDPRAADLDELEITLRFEAGSRKILLGELKTIGPGYTFELEGSPDRPVTIRANGKRIGSGELVRVADRVGVRVLELAREGDSHDAVS